MSIKRDEYISPELEVYKVVVEYGFGNSMEDPDEREEIEW